MMRKQAGPLKSSDFPMGGGGEGGGGLHPGYIFTTTFFCDISL